jgi:hypothetical protein
MPDIAFVLPLVLQSAVVPFGVALALLAVCRVLRLEALGAVLAVAGGFVASYFATLHAQWSLVPKVPADFLPWVAGVAAVAAVAIERLPSRAPRIAGRAIVALVAGALVVGPALESFGTAKAAAAVAVIGLAVTAAWSFMAHVATRCPTPPLLLAVVAGGTGIALMLDSSQSAGQLSGALAAALGACFVFNLPQVRLRFTPAAAGVAVLLLGLLLAIAHLYAGFSLGYVGLLALGLFADALRALLHRVWTPGTLGSWATATVLTAVPVIVTVGLVVKAAADNGGY